MKNKIAEAVIMALVTGIVTFIGSLLLNYFFDNTSLVRVGNSSKIGEDHYIIPINIVTYKETINEVSIGIPENVKEDQIVTDKPVQIELLNSNDGNDNGTFIKIKKVPENIKIQLLISTKSMIETEDIGIHGKNLSIEKISEIENPVIYQLKNLIITSIIYAIFIGISTFWTRKRQEELNTIFREKAETLKAESEYNKRLVKEAKDDNDKIKLSIDRTEEALEKTKNDSLKKQILLQARLNDYRKELSFWRNTIRKLLYQIPSGEEKANYIIEQITNSLKTYQTNEKNENDFETLKVLSSLLKEMDK